MRQFEIAEAKCSATAGCTDLEQRDVRTLSEYMTTLPLGGDVYSVTTQSGSEYRVDAREGRCTCPDHQYRELECKHVRRTAFATGERSIPAWADTDEVDAQLGEHVGGMPKVAVVQRGRENLVVKVLLDAADGLTPLEERQQGVELTPERNAVQVLGTVLLEPE